MTTEFAPVPTVEAFLAASRYAGELIALDRVGHGWLEPSAVEQMSTGEVAGHVFLVLRRVGQRAEEASPIAGRRSAPAPTWSWLRVAGPADLESPAHRQVRQDAAHVAQWGWESVRDAYTQRLERVTAALQGGCPGEVLIANEPVPFVAYLATRVIEMVVHADDLGCSVGLVATPPEGSMGIAVAALLDAARSVHGDLAVLRALSRRERSPRTISVF